MYKISIILWAFCFCLATCGQKRKSSKGGSAPKGEVALAFEKAAKANGIPVRFMMAAAFVESNLSPEKSDVPYFDAEVNEKSKLGTTLTETAFGITRHELGVASDEEGDSLAVQIEAYGRWLGKNIEKKLGLQASPENSHEKYYWIWQLAKLHRNGEDQRRNVRIIWAKDLMRVLNEGRVWQDPKSGERLVMEAENPALSIEDFPADGQKWFSLVDVAADISNARMFELTNENISTLKNVPTHLIVTHCPLSLSSCLELQDSTLDNPIGFGAHFVIPQDEALFAKPLQITQLEHPVQLTNRNGKKYFVTDAVVIMLVGNSGRYINGIRKNADPTWFTSWQLKKLGGVISGVCNVLAQKYDHIDQNTCGEPEKAKGVHFQSQELRANYRWGDIPDFDKAIFYAYLRSSDNNIEGEVAMKFSNEKKIFKAKDEVEVKTSFPPGVSGVLLQRAIRCLDETIVWETVRSDPIFDEKDWPFRIRVLDAGPNMNGRQFLRVLVSGEDSKLMGWAIDDFFITGFDPELRPHSQACYQREIAGDGEE